MGRARDNHPSKVTQAPKDKYCIFFLCVGVNILSIRNVCFNLNNHRSEVVSKGPGWRRGRNN